LPCPASVLPAFTLLPPLVYTVSASNPTTISVWAPLPKLTQAPTDGYSDHWPRARAQSVNDETLSVRGTIESRPTSWYMSQSKMTHQETPSSPYSRPNWVRLSQPSELFHVS
jgi:hypothetical protein